MDFDVHRVPLLTLNDNKMINDDMGAYIPLRPRRPDRIPRHTRADCCRRRAPRHLRLKAELIRKKERRGKKLTRWEREFLMCHDMRERMRKLFKQFNPLRR